MDYVNSITLENPPYKYNVRGKDYYLTANVLFMRDQWIKNEIKKACLRYLHPHFKDVPKLSKLRTCTDIYSFKTGFDLDNKGYFWRKIILDLLKTPTPAQLKRSYLKGNDIVSVNVLSDDTVLYVDDNRERYINGGNKIVFHMKGKLLDVQQKLL